MTWPVAGCYTPTKLRHSDTVAENSTDVVTLSASEESCVTVSCGYYDHEASSQITTSRCPLHKHIRNKAWPTVKTYIQKHPNHIAQLNRMGWSSLVLAVYHDAPVSIIAGMLSLVSENERKVLLSTPVPNGARLCLHFCARFSSNVETFRLLVEAYPLALVVPSADGNRPLDRAIYYHKETEILRYLEESTKKQLAFIDNIKLRRVVLDACALQWNRIQRMKRVAEGNDEEEKMKLMQSNMDDKTKFVLDIYGYAKEREMIGMFWEILSYVGIPAGRQHHHHRAE